VRAAGEAGILVKSRPWDHPRTAIPPWAERARAAAARLIGATADDIAIVGAPQQIKDGTESISARLIDVSMGVLPLDLTMNIVGRENIKVLGKVVPAVVWEATISNMPGVTVREYVDGQGRTIKSSIQLIPGMDIEMIQANEQLAKAEVTPPEVMGGTLVRPDKPIVNPRGSRRAIYRVSLEGGNGAALHLPRAGYQRVVYDSKTTAAVVLDLDSPVNAIDDLPTEANLESSSMIDHESAAVRELMDRALPDSDVEMTDAQKASHLRAFVYDYIDEIGRAHV